MKFTKRNFILVAIILSFNTFGVTYECSFKERESGKTGHSIVQEIGEGVLTSISNKDEALIFQSNQQVKATIKLYKLGHAVPDTFGISSKLRLMIRISSPEGIESTIFGVDNKRYSTPLSSLQFNNHRFVVQCN